MKLGLIGDVHAEDALLAEAIARLQPCDAILCTGDIVDGEGDVDRCCALLVENGVRTVRGNHERWFLGGTMRTLPHATLTVCDAARSFLAGLPATLEVSTPRGLLLLAHGVGAHDMARLTSDVDGYGLENLDGVDEVRRAGVRYHVGGHTHDAMARTLGQTWFLNAGTLKRGRTQVCALLDLDAEALIVTDLATGAEKRLDLASS